MYEQYSIIMKINTRAGTLNASAETKVMITDIKKTIETIRRVGLNMLFN
jgi:hypothetical protein